MTRVSGQEKRKSWTDRPEGEYNPEKSKVDKTNMMQPTPAYRRDPRLQIMCKA